MPEIYDIILPEEVLKSEQSQSCEVLVNVSQSKLTHLFIVMEYGDIDLSTMLQSKVKLGEEHVITIIYNLLCALNFIHSANIMHRDIKTSNILIDDNCTIKICDFGLSRVMQPKTDRKKDIRSLGLDLNKSDDGRTSQIK